MSQDLNRHLGRMKDAWRQEFRQTRAEITRLQAKLDELKQKLNNADEILAAAKADKGRPDKVGNRYAKMGATDAVRDFFSQHRFTRHSISDVTRQLQREGFQSGAQSPRDIVSITCRRLYKQENFLDSELHDGTRVSGVKNKTELLKNGQAGAGKPTPAVQSISR